VEIRSQSSDKLSIVPGSHFSDQARTRDDIRGLAGVEYLELWLGTYNDMPCRVDYCTVMQGLVRGRGVRCFDPQQPYLVEPEKRKTHPNLDSILICSFTRLNQPY
jgi:hypothetical protein